MTTNISIFDHHPKRVTTVCRISERGETTPAQRAMMTRAIFTLAMEAAKMVVKDQLRRQCRRLCDVEQREIMQMAREYFDAHPAPLIAKAKETVDLWFRQGRFGPRGGFR
jgi:hypothetical protein